MSEDGLKSSSSDEHLSKSQALNQTEKKLIGAASRTAQILLQDEGIRMTRSLRKKIIAYQGDLGAKILDRQKRGLDLLKKQFERQQQKQSFEMLYKSWVEVEVKGDTAEKLFGKSLKRGFIKKWQESLSLKRHLEQQMLKAFSFHKQSKRL